MGTTNPGVPLDLDETKSVDSADSLHSLPDESSELRERGRGRTLEGREGEGRKEAKQKKETAEASKKKLQKPWKSIETLRNFARLSDEKRGIRPWGFADETKEKKFVEYHRLTFMNNYRLAMSRVFALVTFVHFLYTVRNLWKLEVATTTASALRYSSHVQ